MADAKRPVSIAVMKGWLFKNHHAALKGSDKRWFELHGTELRYYEKETSSVPNRIISVAGAKWQDGTKTATKITFTLSTPVKPTQHCGRVNQCRTSLFSRRRSRMRMGRA